MRDPERTKQGVAVLREAEAALQRLMAEASAASDYEAVVELASMAQAVAHLIDSSCGSSCAPDARSVGTPPRDRQAKARRSRHRKSQRRTEYPKFLRHGDELVKVGWSKRQKKEYRHRAPRWLIDTLLKRLFEVGREGKLFTTDDLLPLHEPADGTEAPTYQVYIVLAWLVKAGVIVKHGRQGYTVCDPGSLADRADALWRELETA